MSEQYNKITAFHYAEYRPPLHKLILEQVLTENQHFNQGLDIGCGTGYSAIALARYCEKVTGVDPSQSMLNNSAPHSKVHYIIGSGENTMCRSNSIDIVTFAGSLFYIKSKQLIEELKRICKSKAIIIAYDFEILLDNILSLFNMYMKKSQSQYNHKANFSGNINFKEINIEAKQIKLKLTHVELAHILLSNSNVYNKFVKKYAITDPFYGLTEELKKFKAELLLKVNIYFSKYHLIF